MHPTVEKRFARVQEATRLGLANRMTEREKKIIDRLVFNYRSGTLTNEMLHAGIATIAELRSIITESETDSMQAADDITRITTSTKE